MPGYFSLHLPKSGRQSKVYIDISRLTPCQDDGGSAPVYQLERSTNKRTDG